jgi:hypothetical protein
MLGERSEEVTMTAHTSQQNQRIYRITLRGPVDEEFVAAYCPAGTALTCDGDAANMSNIQADQAGIVGLVRHLHNLGYTILALES